MLVKGSPEIDACQQINDKLLCQQLMNIVA